MAVKRPLGEGGPSLHGAPSSLAGTPGGGASGPAPPNASDGGALPPRTTRRFERPPPDLLRIRTSQVAAVAGYNPWADPHKTFLQHLYFGSGAGWSLRQFDRLLLGLRLVDDDDGLRSLLALATDAGKEAEAAPLRRLAQQVSSALNFAANQTGSRGVAAAGDAATNLITRAREAGILPSGDAGASLQRSVRSSVNTAFGTRTEEGALRLYEQRTGSQVRCSNEAVFCWNFPRSASASPFPATTLPPRAPRDPFRYGGRDAAAGVCGGGGGVRRGCVAARTGGGPVAGSGTAGATAACSEEGNGAERVTGVGSGLGLGVSSPMETATGNRIEGAAEVSSAQSVGLSSGLGSIRVAAGLSFGHWLGPSSSLPSRCVCDTWRAVDRCRAAVAVERGEMGAWLRLLMALDPAARAQDYRVGGRSTGCEGGGCEGGGCEQAGCEQTGFELHGCECAGCERAGYEQSGCQRAGCECGRCERSGCECGGCKWSGCEWDAVGIFSDLRITQGRRLFLELQRLEALEESEAADAKQWEGAGEREAEAEREAGERPAKGEGLVGESDAAKEGEAEGGEGVANRAAEEGIVVEGPAIEGLAQGDGGGAAEEGEGAAENVMVVERIVVGGPAQGEGTAEEGMAVDEIAEEGAEGTTVEGAAVERVVQELVAKVLEQGAAVAVQEPALVLVQGVPGQAPAVLCVEGPAGPVPSSGVGAEGPKGPVRVFGLRVDRPGGAVRAVGLGVEGAVRPARAFGQGVSAFWHGGDAWDVDELRVAVAKARRRIQEVRRRRGQGMKRRREAVDREARQQSVEKGEEEGVQAGGERTREREGTAEGKGKAEGEKVVEGEAYYARMGQTETDGSVHTAPPNLGGIDAISRSVSAATILFTPDPGLFTPNGGPFTPNGGPFTPNGGPLIPNSVPIEPVLFSIVGAVDGISDEVVPIHPNDPHSDEWEVRPLIIEVKNRVRRVSCPPPLYDVVQAVTYCRMLGIPAADLVQALDGDITISRIELDGPPMHHGASWDAHVLPRLRAFALAIQAFRDDTALRVSYLCGDDKWRAQMLTRHRCGFLLPDGGASNDGGTGAGNDAGTGGSGPGGGRAVRAVAAEAAAVAARAVEARVAAAAA